MSLIEEALRKAANDKASRTGRHAAMAPRRVITPAPSRVPEVPSRQFRQVALDPHALHRSRALPALEDVAVLRGYKILRTRVLQRMHAEKWQSVGITGTTTGEGKSLTAMNLAIALAQEMNTWVFLVDLDLQRPQIATYLGMNLDKGLSEYLTGHANPEDIIYEPGIPRLAVVPNFHPLDQASELLSSPRMLDFIRWLQAEQPRRIIVYDMPPLLVSDDVIAFAPHVDSLLMVAAQGQTARRSLENAKEVLADKNLLGVVLNHSSERNDSPYY